jgi:transposase
MSKPYSADLRVRVVEAVDEGATRQEAAERFGVSVSSAVRWHQAWRHEGTIEAKPYGGSRSPLEDYAEEILAVIEEQPDLTLDEVVAVMRKRKIAGSRTALFRFLERHAVTSKKKSFALPNRSGRTWLARVDDGYASRACLIPPTLSSLMRHR